MLCIKQWPTFICFQRVVITLKDTLYVQEKPIIAARRS